MKKKLSFLLAVVFMMTMVFGILPAMGQDVEASYFKRGILTVEASTAGEPAIDENFSVTVIFKGLYYDAPVDEITSPGLTGSFTPGKYVFLGKDIKPLMTFTFLLNEAVGPVDFSNIPIGTTYTVSEEITSAQTNAGWSFNNTDYRDKDRKIELDWSGKPDDDLAVVNNSFTPPPTYNVYYDANTGTGGPDTETVLSNGVHELLTTPAPTKAADSDNTYSFGGWADAPDSTEPITSVIIADDDVTVYAIWVATQITYTVTFETETGGTINGGTSDVIYSGILDGDTFPAIPATVPETDYEFDGWYDSSDNEVTSFPTEVTANSVYTAKWYAFPYGVSYTYVSGTDGKDLPSDINTTTAPYAVSDSATYTVGQTVTRNNPSSSAYDVFDGSVKIGTWNLTSWTPSANSAAMVSGGITFTGMWTFVETGKHLVSYSITGDAPDNSSPTVPYPAGYYPDTLLTVLGSLTSPDTTNDSGLKGVWTFDGWYTDDVDVTGGSFIMPDNAVEFTGNWTFTEYPSFTIEKVDGNGELITSSPAEFTLYNDDGLSDVFGTYSTSGGTVLVDGLTPGTYFLKETKAPAGYRGESTVWTVDVYENSYAYAQVSRSQYDTTSYTIAVYADGEQNLLNEDYVLTVVNTLIPPPPVTITYGTLTVDKTAMSADAAAGVGSVPFAFTVTFTANPWSVTGITNNAGLTGSNGVYSFTLTADAPAVVFSGIPTGTQYTVTETISAAQDEAGWDQGTVTGATGSISAAGATAAFENVLAVVAGAKDDDPASDSGSDEGSASDDGQVAGDFDVLPQTGGISPSTLLGIFGLALIAIGGTAFMILRRNKTGKNKSK